MKAMISALLFLVALLSETPAVAQDGMLKGKAKDQRMAPLADVRITLLDSTSDTIATTLSAVDGKYEFAGIRVGTYTMIVEQVGYDRLTMRGVDVGLNKITFIDATLHPLGRTSEKGNVCKWKL